MKQNYEADVGTHFVQRAILRSSNDKFVGVTRVNVTAAKESFMAMPDLENRPTQESKLQKAGYQRTDEERGVEGLGTVLHEYDVLAAQVSKRRELLRAIESEPKGKKTGVLAFISSGYEGIDADDIPAFGDALLSLGDVDILNLIIDSPGGDGVTAEKIIKLCRSYCDRLRVIIPNRAKSAATIIALGADEIVMGFCSEIGPIDAQIPVLVDGFPHFVSAQSFIAAKDSLEKQFKDCILKKDDPRAILQQVASLNPAFINHCKNLMDFGQDVVRNCLQQYMFKRLSAEERKRRVDLVLKELSTVELFKVHGRMIDANAAKTRLHLNVSLLGKDDSLWSAIWGYYLRAYVLLSGRLGGPASKLVETKSRMLIKQAT